MLLGWPPRNLNLLSYKSWEAGPINAGIYSVGQLIARISEGFIGRTITKKYNLTREEA